MQTHVGEKVPFLGNATRQTVTNIDELIGKTNEQDTFGLFPEELKHFEEM